MAAFLLDAFPIFLAGLGCGLILAAFMGPPKRRQWRDRPRLPTFIIKE